MNRPSSRSRPLGRAESAGMSRPVRLSSLTVGDRPGRRHAYWAARAAQQVGAGAGSGGERRKIIGEDRGRPENDGKTAWDHAHRYIAHAVQDGEGFPPLTGLVGDLRDDDIRIARLVRQRSLRSDVHVGSWDAVHGQPTSH